APDDTAKQLQQFEIEQKFLRRRSDFGVHLGTKRRRPVNFRVANDDIFLSRGISHDVNGVPHLRKSIGHFSNAGRRAMVGRERTCGYHRDGVAFCAVFCVSSMCRRLAHLVIIGNLRYGLTVWREMIRAGTPITVQLLGTSATTKEFALTTTLSPTVTPPITLHPAPK